MHAVHQHYVAQGRAALCHWCSTPIVHDPAGRWIHTSLSYVCRDPCGGIAATTAEPMSAPSADEGMDARTATGGNAQAE